MKVLETRLYPPAADNGRVERAVARRALALAESRRLTLVRAPAGYGKTTLMVDCFRTLQARRVPVVWLSLGEFNGSAAEFVAYLAHAVVHQGLGRGDMFDGLAFDAPDEGAAAVCAGLEAICRQAGCTLHVFLDDFDAVHGTPAERLFATLLRQTTETVHWVVGSRSHPQVPLSRMRAQGRVGEIKVDDLRFSPDESAQFLAVRGKPSQALMRFVHERTEGWAAGIRLISIALERSGGDEAGFIARCRGRQRDIATFFREEIFTRLDEDMQEFLLRTCMLGRFTPDLCDALTGRRDARRMIERLEEENLFVARLDESSDSYRYHGLFAEFLLEIVRTRDPSLESALHLQASRWLSERGLTSEAIAHAIRSNDEPYTMRLLDQTWHDLTANGDFVRAGHMISSLPAGTLRRFPRLELWYAVYLIVQCRFSEARSFLVQLEDQFSAMEGFDEPERDRLRHTLRSRHMLLATFSGEVGKLEHEARELLERADASDVFARGSLLLALIVARREQYRVREGDDLIVGSRDLYESSGYRSMLVWHACVVGPTLTQRGETHAAVTQYREAVEIARGCGEPGADSELLSMPLALLAESLLERNVRDEACTLFERAENCASGLGTPDYWVARHVSRARLAFFDGDAAASEDLLDEGHRLATSRRFDRLHWAVVHERIRQAVLRADVQGAARIAAAAGLSSDAAALRPAADVITVSEIKALAWIRVAIATGRHAQALRLLRDWMSFAEPLGALATLLRLSLLAARALHAGGELRGALRMTRRAFDFAAPGGMVFAFLEEGEPVCSLAARALEADPIEARSRPFHRRLAQALSIPLQESSATDGPPAVQRAPAEAGAVVAALTQREIEILRQVARGMLYKETADRLGLTEGSVKWYMQQIYGKLGVRRRQRAVEMARSLGYV